MSAGQLGGLLYPTEDVLPHSPLSVKQAEALNETNPSFGHAIEAWNRHQYKDAYRLFGEHIQAFPQSPWVGEARLHQGCEARYEGRMNEAEQTYRDIITANQNKTGAGAKRLVNKARLRMANLKVLQNDIEAAKDYYRQLKAEGSDWRDRTYASHWLLQLSKMKQDNLSLLDCGTQVLSHVLEQAGKKQAAKDVLAAKPNKPDGFSLKELQTLAKSHHYNLVGLRLKPEELKKLKLPAIAQVEWQNGKGHYWVIEGWNGDRLKLYDPQNQDHYEQNIKEFAGQWQGALLVFAHTNKDKKALPGEQLALAEMDTITGGCCGLPAPASDLGEPPTETNPPDDPNCGSANGQPVWQVNPITMNFYMKDIPLWYSPAKGPSMEFKLSYNSQATTNYYEPFGNKWQFNYNTFLVEAPGGNVTVFLPDGKQIIFVHSASGYALPRRYGETVKLVKLAANNFTLSYSNGTVYTYSIPGGTNAQQVFLTAIKDAHNNQITLSYNAGVQLTGITDADGKTSTLAYNPQGQVSTITDPFGRSAHFTYDSDNSLTRMIDMGGIKTDLGYDADKNISAIDYGQGQWTIYTEPSDGIDNGSNPYPAPGKGMWENYRITITSPLGNKEEYHYDGYSEYSWHVSPRHYINYTSGNKNNYKNAVKTVFELANHPGGGGMGIISSITRPAGDWQGFTYNAGGKLIRYEIWDSPSGLYYYAYNTLNHLSKLTEPNAHVTNYAYAANGEDLLSITDKRGARAFEYNATHDLIGATDRLGNKTAIDYNSYGQPTQTTDPQGTVTQYLYNAENRLAQITRDGQTVLNRTYDLKGRVASETGAEGLTLGYAYDDLDRLIQVNYPDGKHTTIQWSAIRPWMIDRVNLRDGRTATFSHDAEQRLTIEINAENGVSRYEYDKNGNLIRFTDTNSVVTQWSYDANNRVNKKTYADVSQESYSWNSRDQLAAWRNARNMQTVYSYNGNAKLEYVDYPSSTVDTSLVYDSYSRVTQRTDALGIFTYRYDVNDNLVKANGPWANDVITYQYNTLNRRKSMSVQGGQSVAYSYDTQGRQSGLTVNGQSYTFSYDGASPLLKTLTRPNGSATHYQRDNLLRTTRVSNETSAAAVISRHDYSYNAQDLKSDETIVFGAAYTLNAPGVKTYQHNVLNQVLKSDPPQRDYLYDADGNLTQGYTPQGYLFTAKYDAANRLQQLLYTDSGNIKHKIVYSYGGDGWVGQIDKYTGAKLTEQTRLVRDGFLVVQELDGLNGNAVKRQYVWQNNAQGGIGRLLALLQDGQRYDYLYDDNGNVMALLDDAQTVVAQYSYSPFGQLQTASGPLANQPMRFSTKYYDPETGLSDFGYRFYRADVGKWLNRDPIGERGGVNLYGFVRGNPINLIDPFGLMASCTKLPPDEPPGLTKNDPGQDPSTDDPEPDDPPRDCFPDDLLCQAR